MKISKEAVIVTTLLLVIVPTAFGLAVTPPSLFFGIDPSSQDVQAGGSATFTVNIYPQGDWKTGTVTLSLVDPPQGVTAIFDPEKMENIEIDGAAAKMTVKVGADVPQGKVTLTVEGTGTALPQAGQQGADLESKSDVTVAVAAVEELVVEEVTFPIVVVVVLFVVFCVEETMLSVMSDLLSRSTLCPVCGNAIPLPSTVSVTFP